jgi:curved DNA-binding protein CbpA
MKSAYSVLGVPGNASTADIDAAFQKAAAHYSKERLASDPDAIDRLLEIREANKLLSDPAMRAAHDRKLNASAGAPPPPPTGRRTTLAMEAASPAWYTRSLVLATLAVAALFAAGGYMSHKRDVQRKEIAALELSQKKLEAEEAARIQAEQNQRESERARADTVAQARERQLRNESSYAAIRAANNDRQVQSQVSRQVADDRRNDMMKVQQAKSDERQRTYDAQRRVAEDQQRIRNLCLQNYGRSNC